MATTIPQSFADYATNLEITDNQASVVGTCRTNVVKKIKNELTLHSDESKVIGSWDRNTLTRYLSEGDVDVMILLHYGQHKDWDNPDGTIRVGISLRRYSLPLIRNWAQHNFCMVRILGSRNQ